MFYYIKIGFFSPVSPFFLSLRAACLHILHATPPNPSSHLYRLFQICPMRHPPTSFVHRRYTICTFVSITTHTKQATLFKSLYVHWGVDTRRVRFPCHVTSFERVYVRGIGADVGRFCSRGKIKCK